MGGPQSTRVSRGSYRTATYPARTRRPDGRKDLNQMPTKSLELPLKVAQAFARDMLVFRCREPAQARRDRKPAAS